MSRAPILRKSPQALSSAKANAASRKPAPHQVVLRIKRKRSDAAVESLLVATDEEKSQGDGMPGRKRRAHTGFIEDTLAVLSLNNVARGHEQQPQSGNDVSSRLFYKRMRTTEPDGQERKKKPSGAVAPPGQVMPEPEEPTKRANAGGGRLDALLASSMKSRSVSPAPAMLDYLEVRRVKARAINSSATASGGRCEHPVSSPPASVAAGAADFHVIDLQAVGCSGSGLNPTGMDGEGRGIELESDTSSTRPAAPVLNPLERQMDEAIFTAFRTGDISCLRGILASSPTLVNYRRRLGDGTTALMAAAFHGDLDTVRYILSIGAKASLVDADDKSAALFAGMRGHRECFAELQRASDEEGVRSTRRQGAGGRDDFVYDLYYFEPFASRLPAAREGESMLAHQAGTTTASFADSIGEKTPGTVDAPVVHISGIGPVDENAGGTADVELQFEHDSDWSELGDGDAGEDPDSNSEGFYGNDYPEDEDGEGDTGARYLNEGSSCPSEDGSSSDGRLDSDNDADSRRVMGTRVPLDGGVADISGPFGDDGRRFAQQDAGSLDGYLYTGSEKAGVDSWNPKRSDGEESSGSEEW